MEGLYNAMKILAVDDEEGIRKIIMKVLTSEGFDVTLARNSEEAIRAVRSSHFDLLIIDILLDGESGYSLIRRVREEGSTAFILILSAVVDDCDKVYGLSVGADDYMTKPFSPMVLTAKVKALIRRHSWKDADGQSVLALPPFRYNIKEMRLYKDDKEIHLTLKESMLMRLFMENPNMVLSMDQIYEQVWYNAVVDNNTIMVHIQRLRRKIEDTPSSPRYIRTVRGLGYQFFV